MFVNTSEENWLFNFSNNIAKTCSYELKISKNVETEYLFHFKSYFHVLNTFPASCLSALSLLLESVTIAKFVSLS